MILRVPCHFLHQAMLDFRTGGNFLEQLCVGQATNGDRAGTFARDEVKDTFRAVEPFPLEVRVNFTPEKRFELLAGHRLLHGTNTRPGAEYQPSFLKPTIPTPTDPGTVTLLGS